jgi:hypothetical protein
MDGNTALHLAILKRSSTTAKMLLEVVGVKIRDNGNGTTLNYILVLHGWKFQLIFSDFYLRLRAPPINDFSCSRDESPGHTKFTKGQTQKHKILRIRQKTLRLS